MPLLFAHDYSSNSDCFNNYDQANVGDIDPDIYQLYNVR